MGIIVIIIMTKELLNIDMKDFYKFINIKYYNIIIFKIILILINNITDQKF